MPMKFKTRVRGSARQVGKKFPLFKKKKLPPKITVKSYLPHKIIKNYAIVGDITPLAGRDDFENKPEEDHIIEVQAKSPWEARLKFEEYTNELSMSPPYSYRTKVKKVIEFCRYGAEKDVTEESFANPEWKTKKWKRNHKKRQIINIKLKMTEQKWRGDKLQETKWGGQIG